jgi:hypothetical protein
LNQLFEVEQSEGTNDDFLTPRWVFDALGLTFDLDVASPPWETYVPAARKLTKADDGLTQPWSGRVWMNPPFSRPTPWVRRFIDHGDGVALLPMAKSAWVVDLWGSSAVLAVPHRFVEFERGGDSAHIQFMVMFAAFGDECAAALGGLGRLRVQEEDDQ